MLFGTRSMSFDLESSPVLVAVSVKSISVLVPSPKIHTTVSFPKKHNSLKFVISIASSLFYRTV